MRKTFSEVQKRIVAARQGWKCVGALCHGQNALTAQWELDHQVPLFHGGTNDLDNLQVLCAGCHRIKTQQERVQFYYEQRLKRCETSCVPKPSRKFATPKLYYDSCNARWIVLYNEHGRVRRLYFSDAKYGCQDSKCYAEASLESLKNSEIACDTLATS